MRNISVLIIASLLLSACGNMYGNGYKGKVDTSNVEKSTVDHVGNVSRTIAGDQAVLPRP
jgi:hypothetical protein